MLMQYTIRSGMTPPNARPSKRSSLDGLVILAKQMNIGEAVLLTQSEAQTFRVILAAQGFSCITDGYRGTGPKIWAFKLSR